jgi:hypothetical protein
MSSMRRNVFFALALFAVVAAVATVVLLLREPPITEVAYEQLRLGMTEAEVKAVLPFPPGAYAGYFGYGTGGPRREGQLAPGISFIDRPDGTLFYRDDKGRETKGHWWLGSEGMILVFYGTDRTVIERRFYTGHPTSFCDAVRRWLGL